MKMQVVVFAIVAAVSMSACSEMPSKSQLDRDTDACAYGAQVPRNYDTPQKRHEYIYDIAVPACLKAKGYAAN